MPLIRRIARWIGVDRNPLRRPVDRFECAVRLALVVAFFTAGPPIASAAGHLTEVAGLRQVHHEASWRQVRAVLLRPAPPRLYGYGSMQTFWVAGRWRAPSGAPRRGLVPTRSGVPAGAQVSIWVNWAGRVTGGRPMTVAMVKVKSALFELGSWAGLAVALLIVAALTRVLLNRRRMRWWGIEWACYGPRWTTRRWPRHDR